MFSPITGLNIYHFTVPFGEQCEVTAVHLPVPKVFLQSLQFQPQAALQCTLSCPQFLAIRFKNYYYVDKSRTESKLPTWLTAESHKQGN
ncbi:hypothetical protein ACTXT7_014067 [Hymenolepis weldensis]